MEALRTTRGRRDESEKYQIRMADPFDEDFTRIIRCPTFRREQSKTQVIPSPSDHYIRDRLTHSLEVVAISMQIAGALGLNKELCRAIAAGHDLGHTPFGHLGEEVISKILGIKFKHNICSVVVAQHIENKGKGLNLSHEVLEGILMHSSGNSNKLVSIPGVPHEYNVVRLADKIAYTSSDINDAARYGYLHFKRLPDFMMRLGSTQDERDFNVVKALVEESKRVGLVQLTEGEIADDFNTTRSFMTEEVYKKIDHSYNRFLLNQIYGYLSKEPYLLDNGIDPIVPLILLTDCECEEIGKMMRSGRIFNYDQLRSFSLFNYLGNFKGKKYDFTDPDLEWGKHRVPMMIAA